LAVFNEELLAMKEDDPEAAMDEFLEVILTEEHSEW
jgi:hypothetical protein